MKSYLKEGLKPLVLFFILAFLIAWGLMGLAVAENFRLIDVNIPMEPLLILGSWVPNIAAFLVLGFIVTQKGGIIKLLEGWTKFRVPFVWYLVALSPILIAFITAGLYRLIYGEFPLNEIIFDPVSLMVLVVMIIITGALGEELGWRGFALPELQKRMNALSASLLLGVIWVLWHLPLWFAGLGFENIPYWSYAITGISFTILVTWALSHTKGSLVIASLFHLALNLSVNMIENRALPVHAFIFLFFAVMVVWIFGPARLSRSMEPATDM